MARPNSTAGAAAPATGPSRTPARRQAIQAPAAPSATAPGTPMAATPVVTACHKRYSPVKSCRVAMSRACAAAPNRPNGTAQAATSRMTPRWPPLRRYRRLATTRATMIPAVTHSA